MKLIITEALKSRLRIAASNGSIIARDVLAEINKRNNTAKMLRGNFNNFNIKSYHKKNGDGGCGTGGEIISTRLVITCCNKSINNPNFPDYKNPNAAWLPRNRTELNLASFVDCFVNLPKYESDDMTYFNNVFTINKKVTVRKLDKHVGFLTAYAAENYAKSVQNTDLTLWNSCMRSSPACDIAADFYGNLCKAKIIVAQDEDGYVYGRALLWENLETRKYGKVSLIDRIYYTHDCIATMMLDYAKKTGVTFRKRHNTYDSQLEVQNLNCDKLDPDQTICLKFQRRIQFSKWYGFGVPYMDTLDYITVINNRLYLTNYRTKNSVVYMKNTGGYAQTYKSTCPICGAVIEDALLCPNCEKNNSKETEFGRIWNTNLVSYMDNSVPSLCFKNGAPRRALKNWTVLKLIGKNHK
jgi:hypothetical protein